MINAMMTADTITRSRETGGVGLSVGNIDTYTPRGGRTVHVLRADAGRGDSSITRVATSWPTLAKMEMGEAERGERILRQDPSLLKKKMVCRLRWSRLVGIFRVGGGVRHESP
jgi:hypothetical protein